jgi:hypothetical protein
VAITVETKNPLKSPELKENKIVPSCFIPYSVSLFASQQYNILSFPEYIENM